MLAFSLITPFIASYSSLQTYRQDVCCGDARLGCSCSGPAAVSGFVRGSSWMARGGKWCCQKQRMKRRRWCRRSWPLSMRHPERRTAPRSKIGGVPAAGDWRRCRRDVPSIVCGLRHVSVLRSDRDLLPGVLRDGVVRCANYRDSQSPAFGFATACVAGRAVVGRQKRGQREDQCPADCLTVAAGCWRRLSGSVVVGRAFWRERRGWWCRRRVDGNGGMSRDWFASGERSVVVNWSSARFRMRLEMIPPRRCREISGLRGKERARGSFSTGSLRRQSCECVFPFGSHALARR